MKWRVKIFVDLVLPFGLCSAPFIFNSVAEWAEGFSVCQRLGLPLHPDKTVGQSTRLTVLGIELDTILQIARLPPTKLLDLKLLLREWSSRKWCTRVQLESLIGKLHHACLVVWSNIE